MERKTILKVVPLVLGAVLLPISELTAVDAHGLTLTRPMVVDGIYLRAAVYDVQWHVEGTHATVTFLRKAHVVATVQGELVTLDRSVSKDTLYFSKHLDGLFHVNGLGFANTNKGIAFPHLRIRPNVSNNNPALDPRVENYLRNQPRTRPRVYK